MTIQQANEYFASLSDGFIKADALRSAVGQPKPGVRYIGVAGTAGKTAVASLTASILKAAGFVTGRYRAGTAPLSTRILVGEQPVDEALFAAVAGALSAGAELPTPAAELAAACLCFEQTGCAFAVVELPDTALAAFLPDMPACAVTHVGPDGSGHAIERLAHLAADVMRKGALCVTAPDQYKDALSEIIVTAGKKDCALVVPDEADLDFPEAKQFVNMVNYGGYEAALPFIGHHAACNAAVAVELVLGLWRTAQVEVPDEAILAGLAAPKNISSIYIAQRRPLLILDACHTPEQVYALTRVLKMAKLAHLSAIVGLSDDAGAEEFFSAMETGFLSEEEDTEKNRMPGMATNPFDKIYLVAPPSCTAQQTARIAQKAKFHFDVTCCEGLDAALAAARADAKAESRGILICGGEEVVAQAAALLKIE
jgi:dihydrofolate synthase/folylpolyglutamate synthase